MTLAGPGVRIAAFAVGASLASQVPAAELSAPPHVPAAGREDFASYLASPPHKAFAIAPGGAWAWVSGEASPEAAGQAAIARCAEQTEQACVPYAVDGRRVLDEQRWPTLWRLPPARPGEGAVGLRRGAVFPELSFAQTDGKPRRLSEWRGRVVVLHFWGSWCGPCRHELPDMARVARESAGKGIAFLPLQVREPFATSKRWIDAQKIDLPLYDSGMKGSDDDALRIAGGGSLPDRAVAPVFPSTVVLDKSGRVVFTHAGPIEHWSQYLPFLRALAR
jgi:thiol-disulfide isomerase/thioredoxin